MNEPTIDVRLTDDDIASGLRADVLAGLASTPKTLPPKWFYDAAGSELFERITRLPEYYPTRAEREILRTRAVDIAAETGAGTLIELGSGAAEKTRLLLDALSRNDNRLTFVPLDVSESALRSSVEQIAADYPGLRIHGVVGDFLGDLGALPSDGNRLLAFLGGTIGNLLPDERAKFLARMRAELDAGDWLLLGTDVVKDASTLVRAYDDAAGVTAEFNRNVLRVLNRELGADFEPAAFEHVAVWDANNEWIEMRLRARRQLTVRISLLHMEIHFADGEEMRTEISAKFRRDRVADELSLAGFAPHRWWTDDAGRFALSLARAS